jgi:hypothetical protein
MRNFKPVALKLYVPVTSILLVLLVGNWLSGSKAIDPLTAAQNNRIRFQVGGESSASKLAGLTTEEATLAKSVLHKDREVNEQSAQLLYVGNSQTIAIMDQRDGDMITPQWLQILLKRRHVEESVPIDVHIGSLPNLTAPELLIRLVVAGETSPRQVDILIGSAVLEEFRGLGVRDEVADLAKGENIKARLGALIAGNLDLTTVHNSLAPLLDSSASATTPSSHASAEITYSQKLEDRLQSSIEAIPLFANRQNLQAKLMLGFHEWRNRLLGITSSSARPVPDAAYRASVEMIELALRYAQSKGIHVVLYLAPMRPIQPNPNFPPDVARFRRDLPPICQRYGATCLDYVDLVPEELWTNYPDDAVGSEGQRDFAHFTGRGHKLVADKLMSDVGTQLIQWAQEKGRSSP